MCKHRPGTGHIVPDVHTKGTVRLTSAAHQAIVSRGGEGPVVLCHGLRHRILLGGQIQELGYSRNVDVGRAGLAVVAVHAPTGHIDGVSGAEDMGVAPLRRGNVVVSGGLQHLFRRVAAHNDHLDAVAVQAVLDALGDRHGHAEGGSSPP